MASSTPGSAGLPRFLPAGDLLVVNTSATLAAAVDGRRGDGRPVVVHFSAVLRDGAPGAGTAGEEPPGEEPPAEGTWLIELREGSAAAGRVTDAAAGEIIRLPDGASLTLLRPYPGPDRRPDVGGLGGGRRRRAARSWPGAAGRSATPMSRSRGRSRPTRRCSPATPGSAEMPSAGRPFTPDLVTDLIAAGVVVAPITLHSGVASLEAGEPPLPERFTVPEPTAQLVNLTRAAGRRVVAVGTTVHPGAGERGRPPTAPSGPATAGPTWCSAPDHPARVVNGLVTGWHDPEASHLALLEAVAGPELVRAAYLEAEQAGYLWHEFGDSCLLLPPLPGGLG